MLLALLIPATIVSFNHHNYDNVKSEQLLGCGLVCFACTRLFFEYKVRISGSMHNPVMQMSSVSMHQAWCV